MVLAHFRRPVPTLFTLLAEGLEQRAFNRHGWIHAGLAELGRRHGLQTHARPLDLAEVADALHRCGPVVVSVGHHFPTDGRRGGHLVIVAGLYGIEGRPHLEIRDPSPLGAAFRRLPLSRVAASYSGRAIVFGPG
jgi:hypothetical protein